MVQGFIDPGVKDVFDLGEIAHHAPDVQGVCAQLHFHLPVVPVEVAAFAIVVHEPVAVAEMDFLRHVKHEDDYNHNLT
jgi:hypothetical protein